MDYTRLIELTDALKQENGLVGIAPLLNTETSLEFSDNEMISFNDARPTITHYLDYFLLHIDDLSFKFINPNASLLKIVFKTIFHKPQLKLHGMTAHYYMPIADYHGGVIYFLFDNVANNVLGTKCPPLLPSQQQADIHFAIAKALRSFDHRIVIHDNATSLGDTNFNNSNFTLEERYYT